MPDGTVPPAPNGFRAASICTVDSARGLLRAATGLAATGIACEVPSIPLRPAAWPQARRGAPVATWHRTVPLQPIELPPACTGAWDCPL